MSMSCGLPMRVAAAPMLLASAIATKKGTGLSRFFKRAEATMGVKARQTISWFKIADSPAVIAMRTRRNKAGWLIRVEKDCAAKS